MIRVLPLLLLVLTLGACTQKEPNSDSGAATRSASQDSGGSSTSLSDPAPPPAAGSAKADETGLAKLGPNAKTTASGLKYEVLQEGHPETAPKAGERVRVHYTGWLTNGTQFDSSRGGEPFQFTLGRGEVIRGWDEGVALMNEGGKYKLVIPSELGYGARNMGKIPPNSTLVFEVELISVVRPAVFHQPDPAKQQVTESGLKYEVVKEGEGTPPTPEQGAKLKFAIFTTGGQHLISTEASGRHIAAQVKGLRLHPRVPEKFLAEAAQLMKPGSRYVFEVPAELCWGDKPVFQNLPVNATTIWDLELVEINEVPPFEPPVAANQKETPTGLKYEVLREGTGKTPTRTSTVTVHYAGWLTDGTMFDSSYARGETISFPLGRVIPGWTEGLQLMKEGAKYRLQIPPRLGYGARDSGLIPANSTLIFVVELIEVK